MDDDEGPRLTIAVPLPGVTGIVNFGDAGPKSRPSNDEFPHRRQNRAPHPGRSDPLRRRGVDCASACAAAPR
jgi:hypothetical protein